MTSRFDDWFAICRTLSVFDTGFRLPGLAGLRRPGLAFQTRHFVGFTDQDPPYGLSGDMLIFTRLFRRVDHQDVDRCPTCVELQPKLFLQRRDERWLVA